MNREELDKIRSKLGVKGMGEEDKKRLFQNFVNAGGKVLEVKDKAKSTSSQRVRTMPFVRRSVQPSTTINKKNMRQKQVTKTLEKSDFSRWVERVGSDVACVFSGILKWNRREYARGFYHTMVENTQNHLLEIQMILVSVLHQNEKITSEIKQRLKRGQTLSYDYELLYRLDELYDESFFKKMKESRGDLLEVSRTAEEIKIFFKQLFVMKPHVFALKMACEKALMIEKNIRRLSVDASGENIRKLHAKIDFLFDRVYPKLMLLIDYFYKHSAGTLEFSGFINMGEIDELGYYTLKWKNVLESEEQKQRLLDERKRQEQGENVPEDSAQKTQKKSGDVVLKQGLKILSEMLNLKEKWKEYRTQKDLRSLFVFKDKVFLIYVLLDLFEKEYSFIFTSGKVVFNVVFQEGGRSDIRKELSDYYYNINGIYERVNEYLKVLRDIYKVEQDHYAGMREKSARLNQISIHRSQISRKIRKEAFGIFEKFTQTLLFVLTDYEEGRNILQNGEDQLELGQQVEKNRRSNGKKTVHVVEEAYQICYTIRFLLGDGDLGGYPVLLEKPIYLKQWMREAE